MSIRPQSRFSHPVLRLIKSLVSKSNYPGLVKEIVHLCRLQSDPRECDDSVQALFPYLLGESENQQFVESIGQDGEPLIVEKEQILDALLSIVCQGPISSGFLLSCAVTVGPPLHEIQKIKEDSTHKEMKVMEQLQRTTPRVDWPAFFSGPLDARPFPDVPANTVMMSFIRYGVLRWRSELEGMVLYPRINSKSLSRSSGRRLNRIESEEYDREEVIDDRRVTPAGVERMLWEEQKELLYPGSDAAEMRQRWPLSDVKTRTYYAASITQHDAANHLQEVFRLLEDILICSERKNRVTPSRLEIDENDLVMIYDFSSFTSNFHEQIHLLQAIASFLSGTEVYIIHPELRSHVKRDLGSLVLEYIQVCNDQPEYSMERISWLKDFYGIDLIRSHGPAGFLGIHGNLSTCTIGHALGLLLTVDDPNKANSAGDDGQRVAPDTDRFFMMAKEIGEIAMAKTHILRHYLQRAVALKRPLVRLLHSCSQEFLVVWVHFGLLDGEAYQDPRFPQMAQISKSDRKRVVATAVMRLLTAMFARRFVDLDPREGELLRTVITDMYKIAGLPIYGNLPAISPVKYFVVPIDGEDELWSRDPFERTIMRLYTGEPISTWSYDHHLTEDWEIDWSGGSSVEYVVRMNRRISYLSWVGAVSVEPCLAEYSGTEALNCLLKHYVLGVSGSVRMIVNHDCSFIL